MNTAQQLRAAARERLEQAISQAKANYAAELAWIADKHPTMLDIVRRAIPTDRQFTSDDIFAAVTASHPDRNWQVMLVRKYLCQWRDRGLIRRVSRPDGKRVVFYAHVSLPVELPAFHDMTLAKAIASLLEKHGEMDATTIAVMLLEAGYETTRSRKAFLTAVREELRKV